MIFCAIVKAEVLEKRFFGKEYDLLDVYHTANHLKSDRGIT